MKSGHYKKISRSAFTAAFKTSLDLDSQILDNGQKMPNTKANGWYQNLKSLKNLFPLSNKKYREPFEYSIKTIVCFGIKKE